VNEVTWHEGDWISLDGSTGEIFSGQVPTQNAELSGDFGELMKMADKFRRLEIRANADTPGEAEVARRFGATGIGLCRTEHMFFEGDRIIAVREMILADDEAGRRKALAKLLPMQRGDFEGLFREMSGHPVTIRLLDPPLHEFVPQEEAAQKVMARDMKVSPGKIKMRVEELHEFNPMMGHRGCRLGITYPEITEMQARAIIEAALNMKAKGVDVKAEIMIPLVNTVLEFSAQAAVIRKAAASVFAERGETIPFMIGTMIETPRAAVMADSIGKEAEFFSFGTNDLTQMTFGFSRDDAGKFLPFYIKKGLLDHDPFKSLDQKGVGQLVEMAVKKGREARVSIEMGICGEHGGDPSSVDFFHRAGLDYVSCSPYRVPIARLAAAQASIRAAAK
jgi:pyruvate,orthophosphate dikinase